MKLNITDDSDIFFNELHELPEKHFDILYSAGRLLVYENLIRLKNHTGLYIYDLNIEYVRINKLYIRKGLIWNGYISFTRDIRHVNRVTVPFRDAFMLFDNRAQAAKFKLKNF